MDIYIIYDDDEQIKRIRESEIETDSLFHFIDDRTLKGHKEAWKIKSHVAAKENPHISIYKNGNIVKAFYSEASNDVINDLIKYLNNIKE